MTKGELKSIIKEAILELVADGSLSSNLTAQASPTKIVRKEEKNIVVEQRKKHSQQLANKFLNGGKPPANAMEANLLNLLQDTAQNSVIKEQEIEQYGMPVEQREQFDSMFPAELREHFNSLFNKAVE